MTRKSPQEKKQLDYERDHFTPGWNSSSRRFAKAWRGKKTHANRQYRRRSQELLVGMKTGIGEDDLFSDDLTAARFQESVSRKRLRKQGTMTLREKVETKLAKRATMVGRRARTKREAEAWAKSAVATLGGLQAEKFVEASRRAELLCRGNVDELRRVMSSRDPVDRALLFLRHIRDGSGHLVDALRRRPELQEALANWLKKAERADGRKATASPKQKKKLRTGH